MNQYTLTELFGWYVPMPENRDIGWIQPVGCHLCGVAVTFPDKHRDWHNKGN